jgi:pilus assembly protein Flp/PilA
MFMKWARSAVQRFISEERGATAIEYGLIIGIMSIVIIAAFGIFGDSLDAVFAEIIASMGG